MTDMHAATGTVWAELMSMSEVDRRVGLRWLSGLGFNRGVPVDVLLSLLEAGVADVFDREDLPPELLDAAVAHSARCVRAAVAECGRLSADQWSRLIATASSVRERELWTNRASRQLAARRLLVGGRGFERAPSPDAVPPGMPEAIAAMAADVPEIDPRTQTYALWWIGALQHDAEAMRQLAASPNLLVRRSVARATRLPEDVASLLASDEDRVVRLFLAESCDDAPAEMLLEVASWWGGSFSFPGRPRNHPNFPRAGLLRFAADPNPRLRLLALDDPAATHALVEQLGHDSERIVRMAVAEDRRLSPDSLRRLALDPEEGVCWRAWMNPSLPLEILAQLLLDPRSAEFAAHNPVIPIDVVRHMLAVGRGHLAPQLR